MNWLQDKFLAWFLTKERIVGWVAHLLTIAGAWLVTNHYLGDYSNFVALGVAGAGFAWSAATGGKETILENIMGVIRQLLTMGGAIAVFKGWLNQQGIDQIVGLVATLISFYWSGNTPEKSRMIRVRKLLKTSTKKKK